MCLERFVKIQQDSAPKQRARKTAAVHRHQTLFHWNSRLHTAKTSTQLTIRYKQVMHQTDIHSMDELKQRRFTTGAILTRTLLMQLVINSMVQKTLSMSS